MNKLTLGVHDLAGMMLWYEEKFGWTPVSCRNKKVFYWLNGFLLVLVHEREMAKDLYVWQNEMAFKRFIITINFDSEKEVDAAFKKISGEANCIIKMPQYIAGNGYCGYVTDPEDNFWEFSYGPAIFSENEKAVKIQNC